MNFNHIFKINFWAAPRLVFDWINGVCSLANLIHRKGHLSDYDLTLLEVKEGVSLSLMLEATFLTLTPELGILSSDISNVIRSY